MENGAPPDDDVVELELPARPEVVSVVRLVVGALVASDPLFDDERGADLRLAVSEACTNAITSQRRSAAVDGGDVDGDDSILVRCRRSAGRIELTVTDHGRGFDPDSLPSHPPVTDPARLDYEGGLGIPLIRLLSDEVAFDPGPDGTTVSMVFEPRGPGVGSVLEDLDGL